MTTAAPSRSAPNPLRGILVGGLLAGLFDISYAIIVLLTRERSPLWTLQSVASGLLGERAFTGGTATGILGLALHFLIAFTAAATYWFASRRIALLREHPVISGLIYGVLVFIFMNFVVLPLSAYPFSPKYPPAALAKGFFFHAVLVGLPIALAARYAGRADVRG